MTRIALFGGSFNPPHVAHQLVALYVLETQPIDELWIVPVYTHALGKQLADYEHRVAMCELAAAPLGSRRRTRTLSRAT
jgi:nicotinate-nucleotide adenylyltransferase